MKVWTRWRGLDNKNAFYTNPQVKADYKALIKRWATRVNTVTGVRYADDPALFSWELANEPRDEDDPSSKTLAAWADEMGGTFKSLDPKHMVSCGLEGLHATNGTHYSGADFQVVQQSKNIDFATFHFYPISDDRRYSLRASKQAVRDYVSLAHDTMGKPVVMEEFAVAKKYDGDLNRFDWIQTLAETFLKAGGDGENYWMLVDDNYDGGDGNEFQPKDVDYCNLFSRLATAVNTGAQP
jgi:mannan endo-1,4-beta-mannosidase